MQRSVLLFFTCLLIFNCKSPATEIELSSLFADHMVLQRNEEVLLWGWGGPNEKISVTTSWDNKQYQVAPNSDNKWEVHVDTPEAGGPFEITFKGGKSEQVLKDIMIGEVWLCSGQSNMEWSAKDGIDNAQTEIANANFPDIRFFHVARKTSDVPLEQLQGEWKVCSPETMREFSAVAYFFARRLQEKTGIPIGLVDASWGGTPAEVWTPKAVFEQNEEFKAAAKKLEPSEWWPIEPTVLFNGMIHPITKFKIAGTIWYQGESNVNNAQTYEELFTNMIASWRAAWGYDFPFYYAQIAPFEYDTPEVGVLVRDEQRRAMDFPKTGMVLTSDICTVDDIHPRNKKDVGIRLANVALKEQYRAIDDVVYGPLFKKLNIRANEAELIFENAAGLHAKNGTLKLFEVAGGDGNFHPAQARIENDVVIVSSKKVYVPIKVRYAWGNTAIPDLFNGVGLPASSFISD